MTLKRPPGPASRRPQIDPRHREAQPADYESAKGAESPAQTVPVIAKSAGKGPARGYSWPPFEPGHTLSLVHGVYSDRAIEGRAAQVREALLEICPWLDRPEFLPAVARFIRVEARALAGHDYIARTTVEQGFEKVSVRLREVIDGTDRLAARLAENLGLDPIGQARIAALATSAEVGQASLADLIAEGGRIRRAAEARLAVPNTDHERTDHDA